MTKPGRCSVVPGLILITLGIIFLLNNFGAIDFNWENFWAYIILLVGVIFWIGFLADRSKYGLIMPGTIFLVVGLMFVYCTRFGWEEMEQIWPFFLIAPALGMFGMYLLGKHDRGLLIPAFILTALGVVFLLQSYYWLRYLWPVALIAIGASMLARKRNRDESI
ncbi:MAG: hypothetical protein GF417_00150 [Candidatus Latescibacteria bacterium]|nr:hypothetical protein [bacterium]MBD3422839.1 hypothetical protein [Candidatus Latescibacterota bacterium]